MEKTYSLTNGTISSNGNKEGDVLVSHTGGKVTYKITGDRSFLITEKGKGEFSIIFRGADSGTVDRDMEMYFEGQTYTIPRKIYKDFIKGKSNSIEIEQNGSVVGKISRNAGSLVANTDLMGSAILVYMALLSPYSYRTIGKNYPYNRGREEPSVLRIIAYVLIVFIVVTLIFFSLFAVFIFP